MIEKGGGPAVEEALADIIIVVMWLKWGAWKSHSAFQVTTEAV